MVKETKTILFVPLNAHGHINIFVGLADKLRNDHGYRSVFLIVEPAIDSVIKEHKHELVVVKNNKQNVPEEKRSDKMPALTETTMKMSGELDMEPTDRYIKVMGTFINVFTEDMVNNHNSYCNEIRRIKPDLLISEYIFVLPRFKEAIGDTPWVQLYPANPMCRTKSTVEGLKSLPSQVGVSLKKSKAVREKMRQEKPEEWWALVDEWITLSERFEKAEIWNNPKLVNFFRENGREMFELFDEKYGSPYLNIRVIPAEIDYDKEDDLCSYGERWIRCDSFIRDSVNQEEASLWADKLRAAMQGRSKMVYFSLGTLASSDLDLMRRYVEYLSEDTERLYVISKGPRGDELELNAANMIGANYLPQTFILEQADLAIIHGGNNSLTECLYNGVPMIVMPVFADQLDNAQRIEDLELGKRLDIYRCTKDELSGAIDEILSNKTLVEEVRKIGANMKSRNDIRKISLILKKLIEDGQLEQSFIEECKTKELHELQF